jgi:hypothetical protein
MDPVLIPIFHTLAPVLATLGIAIIPIGIIWIVKHHQFRMKELEIEGQRLAGPSAQQLAAIESRLAAIEAALSLPTPRNALQDRAALLTGPATPEETAAPAAALRTR